MCGEPRTGMRELVGGALGLLVASRMVSIAALVLLAVATTAHAVLHLNPAGLALAPLMAAAAAYLASDTARKLREKPPVPRSVVEKSLYLTLLLALASLLVFAGPPA